MSYTIKLHNGKAVAGEAKPPPLYITYTQLNSLYIEEHLGLAMYWEINVTLRKGYKKIPVIRRIWKVGVSVHIPTFSY